MAYTTTSPQSFNVRDAALKSSDTLPNAANTTVNGTAIDLGPITGISSRNERSEVLLSAPAQTVTTLPNADTLTFALQSSNTANFATNTTLVTNAIVQTGNAGAAATTFRYKVPSNCQRYIRGVAVSGVNTADPSNSAANKMTLEVLT
jgi:hypothetical protein